MQLRPIISSHLLEEMIDDLHAMADEVALLAQLTIELIEVFSRSKRERKILDFTDYEHLALDILLKDGQPTPIALNLQQKYKEILVDEYRGYQPCAGDDPAEHQP